MRRLLLSLTILTLVAPLRASSESGHSHYWDESVSISFHDEDDSVFDCTAMQVRSEGRTLQVIEEEVPVAGLHGLKIHSDRNGGIRVLGGNGNGYSVKACKASTLGDARDIRVSVNGQEVTADPSESSSGSIVYFLVRAPRGASLNLTSNNGPIGIRDVDGTVTARATNGPISVKGSSGTLDVQTQNGPISFAGDSGTVKLRAQNGPISLKLSGIAWLSGNLDAQTHNGPLSLKLPRGYSSGVVVVSNGGGPVTCRADACRNAQRAYSDDDDWRPRRIELGSGARAVTVSTTNGPVSIKED